jgi:copper chaperone NosL
MASLYNRILKTLDRPLTPASRVLVLLAAFLVVGSLFVPLWHMTFVAQQYPEGLDLWIYSHDLVGGDEGNDLTEINVLNHYIGMRDIAVEDFTEFKWMPFVLGGLGLLFLRAAVHGKVATLVDVAAVFGYFSGFSLWAFAYKLYRYGHDLAPTASVKVPGFTPPVIGFKQIANFEVYSYPQGGTYAMAGAWLLVIVALVLAWRDYRATVRASAR